MLYLLSAGTTSVYLVVISSLSVSYTNGMGGPRYLSSNILRRRIYVLIIHRDSTLRPIWGLLGVEVGHENKIIRPERTPQQGP